MADKVNIGICVGGWDSTARTRCNELGVAHIRIDGGVQWHDIETSSHNYNWSNIDTCISQNVADGRKVVWILDYNNPVYGAVIHDEYYGTGLINSTMRNGYRDFAVAAVNHLAAKGWLDDVTLEIWNEADIPIYWRNADGSERDLATRANEYETTLNLVIPAMKAAQPNCVITAYSSNYPTAYMGYANNACNNVTSGTWDGMYSVGIHPYLQGSAFNSNPESTAGGTVFEHFHNCYNNMDNNGMPDGKRAWITECGYNTAGDSEVNQTDANMLKGYLPRFILNAMLWGVYNFSAFTLSGTTKYGIYDQGTQPARRNLFKSLCDRLNGATHVGTPINASGNYVMKFTKGNDTIFAYWTTGSNNDKTVEGHVLHLQNIPQYAVYTTTPVTPPSPPASMDMDININWTASTGATSYKIYDSRDGFQGYIMATGTSYTYDNFGHAGEEITFRIYAVNSGGTSLTYCEKSFVMPGTPIPAVDYPLDSMNLTEVVTALATMKIRSDFEGNVLKVKNTTTGANNWLQFSGDTLDKAAVEALYPNANGGIDTWVDQSGHNCNCLQNISNDLKPLLVSNGVLNQYGVYFDGIDDLLPAQSINNDYVAIAMRIRPAIIDGNARYIVQKDGSNCYGVYPVNTGGNNKMRFTVDTGGLSNLDSGNNISVNNSVVVIASIDGTTQKLRVNGVETTKSDAGILPTNLEKISFGKTSYGSPYAGYLDFCIIKKVPFTEDEIAVIEEFLS